MRKIEQQMINAIRQRKDWHSGNTRVSMCHNIARVYLFGNLIAKLSFAAPGDSMPDTIWLSHAGWPTRTTCGRLNALLTTFCARMYDGARECRGYSVRVRYGCMRLVTPSDEFFSTLGEYAIVRSPHLGYLVAVG